MGNVTVKQLRPRHGHGGSSTNSSDGTVFLGHAEARKSPSGSSDTSSQDYLDAESEFHSTTEEDERNLEELINRTHEELINRAHEDAFMKAVLSFCAHMGGRMDTLDNARLYDEFCSYAASHRPNVGVV